MYISSDCIFYVYSLYAMTEKKLYSNTKQFWEHNNNNNDNNDDVNNHNNDNNDNSK